MIDKIKEIFTNEIVDNRQRIGLCLSGGGALGFAHIGVLQALEDLNIYPNAISGSSMGSIVGTLYSVGYSPSEMLDLIKEEKLFRITKLMSFKPNFWNTGLVNYSAVSNLIKELIPNNSTESLNIPMYICVSNLTKAKWEIISETNKIDLWVAASCSIPGVFSAVKINNQQYVDGGLLNNMPAQILKKHCDVIIGSDVIPFLSSNKEFTSTETLVNSIRVFQHQNSMKGRELCDYLVEPKGIEKYHEFSFDAYKEIYSYGYRSVNQLVSSNPDFVQKLSIKDKE